MAGGGSSGGGGGGGEPAAVAKSMWRRKGKKCGGGAGLAAFVAFATECGESVAGATQKVCGKFTAGA